MRVSWIGLFLWCGPLAAAAGCSQARKLDPDVRRCAGWKENIGPLLLGKCVSCHQGAMAGGGYDLATYAGVLGGGSDAMPNAVAGDRDSTLIKILDPATATDPHRMFRDAYTSLATWVVDCNLAYTESSVHGRGIMNPADQQQFHGAVARRLEYDFDFCANCHGADFAGGKAKASCRTCHEGGPTACDGCHASSPRSGPHARHARRGPLHAGMDCTECHVKPALWNQVDHVFASDGALDPGPAEVVFGALAGRSVTPAQRKGPPAWDPVGKTCANVLCHGASLGDPKTRNPTPKWVEPDARDCQSCHGFPPDSHDPDDRCTVCHPRTVDAAGKIIVSGAAGAETSTHVNGVVDVGL